MNKTYRDEFPAGARVVVDANKNEGTDHEFNGRSGVVVEFGRWIAVKFDKLPKYWTNPVLICPHNLRKSSAIRVARLKPDQEGTQLTKPESTQNIGRSPK